MKNLSKIIAKGLLTNEDFAYKLAEAIQANANLGEFLAGDLYKPTIEEAEKYVKEYLSSDKTLVAITDICINNGFRYSIHYKFNSKRYVEDSKDNLYKSVCEKDETHTIEKLFPGTNSVSYGD